MKLKLQITILLLTVSMLTSCVSHRRPAQENNSRARLSNSSSSSSSDEMLSPQMTQKLITGEAKPPKPEEVKKELKLQVNKWWYGHGVGRTATNVAAIVVFPPWGLYLLTNAGIALAGYEPVYITDAIPKETRKDVLKVYDGVTSVPGRVNAVIAGRKFQPSPSVKESDKNETDRNSSKIDTYSSKGTGQRNF